MITKAIKKINTEIKKSKNNSYVKVVGEFLLEHLNANPEAAENIMNTEKTITKSLDEMRKAAVKKKVGNCAVLTDQEGFEIVLKYFGIDTKLDTKSTEDAKTDIDFDVKLEDLI
ncbi:Cas9 inhibitor AcrIIA9 family protein [Tepidibacter hydrothermalis]|uniref:Cas9 inhibitor AcrIIA9 family protein n=1 Tax=Tepidibacter hydrothermalis TaxID=3036126 RepID=A0ABY8EGB2_9FIRM|nr:Cas9 inhibitor AcrIIA9 family protein [Tepidibacter hydrothermalis]WFD11992.1 Cas9 inhibitor AcrIIA9 family protein [Tepidibacter hydrothermalis]